MAYKLSKKVILQDQLHVGETFIYDVFTIRKAALDKQSQKRVETVDSALKWLGGPESSYVVPLSKSRENEMSLHVFNELNNCQMYKFVRSKILLDRRQDSPMSIFVCPEIGAVKYLDDEYTFNFGLDTLYGTESGQFLIDSPNADDWNFRIMTSSKPQNLENELEVLASIIFSENVQI